MGFGVDLQGRSSHEALVKVQDAEIKLLEILKRFITARAEADKQYATNLTKMLNQATKGDSYDLMEFQDCCSVFKAWEVQLKETDNFIRLVRDNSETLITKTLDSLNFLIAEKKNARRSYMDQRNNLDLQMTKHQEEVQKNKVEYSKLMERLRLDKAKYQDAQSKADGLIKRNLRPFSSKGGAKLEDCKSRYVRTMNRLHQQHNDYVLAMKHANLFQESNLQHYLPSTLNCHQAVQELYVRHLKFILQDLARLTDYTLEPFQEVSQSITQTLDTIDPSQEYGAAFTNKYKSEALAPIQFEFDPNLMEDYSGSLKVAQLELDDLTFETLRHKRTRVEDDLNADRRWVEQHQKQLQDLEASTAELEQKLAEHLTPSAFKELVEKKKQEEIERKDLQEKQASILSLEKLLELLSRPLEELGDANPPSAFEATENGDVPADSRSTLSASSKDSESRKKLKMPTMNLNPFKKGDKSNCKLRGSKEDVRGEGGGEVEVRGKPSSNNNRLGGYEQTEPGNLAPTPNGPNRSSMAAMREGGTILTDAMAVGSGRMEDEEWFHGVLPREEVQRLLTEDGDYLVRESKNRKTNETQYVLSVFWQGHKHFIIQGAEEVGWRFEGTSYPTIQELIQKQHASGQPVTNKSQAILKKAILREDWELLNDHIHLEMKIGNGNFGEVYKGLYAPRNMVVAVKTCRDTLSEDQRKKFLQEGRILKQYNHPNIVSFIGIAAQRQPVMIVMEFVSGGALLSFLRKQGKQQTRRQLTQMCVDAANGMAYLESRGCIHRDLAARNCLVGDNSVIKISDFGMSREEEEYTVSEGMKQIPIKWTAPEALNYGKYTSLCDVWSYGILMWEIFSGGQQPYPGMTNAQARQRIEDGYRLQQNAQTPEAVYKLMLKCWEYTPEKRPHFSDLHDSLRDIVRRL